MYENKNKIYAIYVNQIRYQICLFPMIFASIFLSVEFFLSEEDFSASTPIKLEGQETIQIEQIDV